MDRIEEHERMAGIERSPPADPSKIGETASHGCVRLTNRDAEELAAGVKPGVAVLFIRGPDAETAPGSLRGPSLLVGLCSPRT